MKQILKIISVCIFLCLPFATMAQEDFVSPESEDQTPIADNGLSQKPLDEESMQEVLEEIEVKPEIVAPSDVLPPKPLIHIEQLGWNTFKFRSSYRLGLGQYETNWSFGDGQISTQRIVHHTYAKPGVYQVQLEIFTDDGQTLQVSNIVQVGFFNLANWRLWVLIVLLAVIIIIASLIAGVKEPHVIKSHSKVKGLLDQEDDELILNALSDDFGDLDSLGQIGLDTNSLAKELAFLEEMEVPVKKKKTIRKTKQTKEKKKIAVKTKKKVAKTKQKTTTTKKKKTVSKKSEKK